MSTEKILMGKLRDILGDMRTSQVKLNRAHSWGYMPNVPPFWTQSRTDVRSIVQPSSMSTSSSHAISKLGGRINVADWTVNSEVGSKLPPTAPYAHCIVGGSLLPKTLIHDPELN